MVHLGACKRICRGLVLFWAAACFEGLGPLRAAAASFCPALWDVNCTASRKSFEVGCILCLDPRPQNGSDISPLGREVGEANTPLRWNLAHASYADGQGAPRDDLPDLASVSTAFARARPKTSSVGASQLAPYWMLATFFDLVDFKASNERFGIESSCASSWMSSPNMQCSACESPIEFLRAANATDDNGVRIAINKATHAMDLSHIYGTSDAETTKIRTHKDGLLNLTDKGLPWRIGNGTWLLADQRNAYDVGTLAIATMLMREHNRAAALFATEGSNGTFESYDCYSADGGPSQCQKSDVHWEGQDEKLFQAARMWTIAAWEHLTKDEFMASILGESVAGTFEPFQINSTVSDPRVDPLFAAVGSRWAWSAMAPQLRLLDSAWQPLPEYDPLELFDATDPDVMESILDKYGIVPVIRGLIATPAREIDLSVVRSLTEFGDMHPIKDVQRARDLGVPSYNEARAAYNLPEASSYSNISSDDATQAILRELYEGYGGIDNVEALVGALAEDLAMQPLPLVHFNDTWYSDEFFKTSTSQSKSELSSDAPVPAGGDWTRPFMGPLIRAILVDQYRRSFHGDHRWHWHHNVLESVTDYTVQHMLSLNPDVNETGHSVDVGDLPLASFFLPAFELPASATNGSATGDLSVIFSENVYSVAWIIDSAKANITFNFTLVGVGDKAYCALGIGKSMRENADIIFVRMDRDEAHVDDRISRKNALPENDTADTASCRNDLSITSQQSYSVGSLKAWTIAVTRPLKAGDACDKEISDSNLDIIWSFNLAQDDHQHGFKDRGQLWVNFFSGETTATTSNQINPGFYALHGAVMLVAYGLAAPVAWILARYYKSRPFWLEYHQFFGMITAQSSLPIAAAAMASTSGTQFRYMHGRIGLVLFVLTSIQVTTGFLRMLGIENRGIKVLGDSYSRFHWANMHVHRWCGRLVVPLGLANVYIGLAHISPNDNTIYGFGGVSSNQSFALSLDIFTPFRKYLYFAWLLFLVMLFVYLEYSRLRRRREVRTTLAQQAHLPHFTQEEFDDRILQGARWVVVNDMVIDMKDYMKAHPGGSKIIKESVGLDVTQFLTGERKIGRGAFADTVHKHTPAAFDAITPYLVGYLQAHALYTAETLPDREKFEKGESATSSSTASSSGRRGRVFGPSFEQYEVIRRNKMRGPKRPTDGAAALPAAPGAEDEKRPVYRFLLAPSNPKVKNEPLKPGFYHKFRTIKAGTMVQRQYTPIASHLLADGRIGYDYYIRYYAGGQMSEALRHAKVGSVLSVQGPFVIGGLDQEYDFVYMIAGGTGIAPMMQVARYHVRAMLARRAEDSPAGDECSETRRWSRRPTGFQDNSCARDYQLHENNAAAADQPTEPTEFDGLAATQAASGRRVRHQAAAAEHHHEEKHELCDAEAERQHEFSPILKAHAQQALPEPPQTTLAATGASDAAGKVGWKRLKAAVHVSHAISHGKQSKSASVGPAPRRSLRRSSRGQSGLRVAELELMAADGGGVQEVAAFNPATKMSVLWQTRNEEEAFCLGQLRDLSDASHGAFSFKHFYGSRVAAETQDPDAAEASSLHRLRKVALALAVTKGHARTGSHRRNRAPGSFGRSGSSSSVTESEEPSRRNSGASSCGNSSGGESDEEERQQQHRSKTDSESNSGGEGHRSRPRWRSDASAAGVAGKWARTAALARAKVAAAAAARPKRHASEDAGNSNGENSDGAAPAPMPAQAPRMARDETYDKNRLQAPVFSVGTGQELSNVDVDIESGGGLPSWDCGSRDGAFNANLNSEDENNAAEGRVRRWSSSVAGDDALPAVQRAGTRRQRRRSSRLRRREATGDGSMDPSCLADLGPEDSFPGAIDVAALEEMLANVLVGVRWTHDNANGDLEGFAAEMMPPERPDNTIIFVSGPPRFADAIQAKLVELGLPPKMFLFLD